MSDALGALVDRLRRDFDAGFARKAIAADPRYVDVLVVRAGGVLALRVDEISGVAVGPRVVSVPGAPPGLLGIVGLRGALVPVYGLAALLGLPASADPRWLATSGGIALAFEAVEAYERLRPDDIVPGDGGHAAIRAFARTAVPHPLVHLPTLTRLVLSENGAST